jgi:tetratricopeptide (TPR) repeat protein
MVEEPEQISQSMWESIFALGVNFFIQGKYDKACIIFDGLTALDPRRLLSSIAYGELLIVEDQVDKALDHFLNLSKRFGSDCRVLLGAAKACIILNKFDEAKKLVYPIMEGEVSSTPDTLRMAQSIYEKTIISETL